MGTSPATNTELLDRIMRARVRPGTLALWYTGGAGYVIRSGGATILVDPFVGPSAPPAWIRAIPPMFDPERISDLGRIDAVFLTHEHGDHADPVALEPIGRLTSAQIVGPESCVAVACEAGCPADRCRVLARDEAMTIGDLRVTAVKIHDPGAKGCSGYVLETSGLAVLHAGDSTYFPGFVDLGRRWALDAICLSVGSNPPGKSFYMDEVDAARAARDANAKTLIPQHFDLWQGITLDPRRVVTVSRWYCPETRVMPARLGRRLTIDTPA